MMHPMHRSAYLNNELPNSMQLHDIWMPLAEFYTSLALIEKFMALETIIKYGHGVAEDQWPLVCFGR
ncbi:hypothetical protein F4823DRAFT_575032 [Ustulina deusta]|nr:hypothetical protein F4823DRAFT_575032 [Ustulina deusta]